MAEPELTPIETAEQAYGFQFGDPDGDTTRPRTGVESGVVSCTNPVCTLTGHHVQLYSDTPLPVHCGRCGLVLVADPNRTDLSILPGVDMTNVDDVIAETKRQVIEELRNAGHLG
jgi:hypothetical protein